MVEFKNISPFGQIGVTIFNIAMIVVAALEIPQVHKALRLQDESGAGIKCPNDPGAICSGTRDLFPTSQRYLIVVTVLIGVAQFPMYVFQCIASHFPVKLTWYFLLYQYTILLPSLVGMGLADI